jgi:hypothetical protein
MEMLRIVTSVYSKGIHNPFVHGQELVMTKWIAKIDVRWCLDILLVFELNTSQVFDMI